jgi:hypothetical protein
MDLKRDAIDQRVAGTMLGENPRDGDQGRTLRAFHTRLHPSKETIEREPRFQARVRHARR